MIYLRFISLVWLLSSMLTFSKQQSEERIHEKPTIQTDTLSLYPRKSITFIMGEDEKAKNQYYAEAKHYYTYNECEKTDLVVDTCRSLWSIKEYLEKETSLKGQLWGNINIVVHSNEWTGLSMPILPNGERITTTLLEYLKMQNNLPNFSTKAVDAQTSIQFQSCGLGRNRLLVNALQDLLNNKSCPEQSPKVSASTYFNFYQSEKYRGIPIQTEKYQAEVWYAFYKTGYRPGDIKLSRQLEKRYPNAKVNWRAALRNKKVDPQKDLFHYNFTIPIEWIVTFESTVDRPKLVTQKAQIEWLKNQPDLIEELEKYDIPLDKFRWKLSEITYTFEDGVTEPAILAKGLCTVVCILQKV